MKNSTRIILAVTLIGSLGFGGLARNVYAAQSETSIQVAQASDEDGEVDNDVEEQQEAAYKLQSIAKITQSASPTSS